MEGSFFRSIWHVRNGTIAHDASGTIHVESDIIRNYTLGEFLNIWGGLDTNSKTVKATIDGKPVSDYRNIILRDGEQINLDVAK
jgi:hypothetical protein